MPNINDVINNIMLELDISGSEEEILEVKEDLKNKLYQVVLDTLLENLDQDQQKKFLEIIKNKDKENQEDMMAEIEKLSAGVPGLLGQIIDALDRELALLRSLFGKKG